MFFETKVIDGRTYSRSIPGAQWTPMTSKGLVGHLFSNSQIDRPTHDAYMALPPMPIEADELLNKIVTALLA